MAQKSTTNTLLTVGAVAAALIVVWIIFKKLTAPKGASGALPLGGGGGGDNYAGNPLPFSPDPSKPFSASAGLQSGQSGAKTSDQNSQFSVAQFAGMTPTQILASPGAANLTTDSLTSLAVLANAAGGYGPDGLPISVAQNSSAYNVSSDIPYAAAPGLPGSALLNFDAGSSPFSQDNLSTYDTTQYQNGQISEASPDSVGDIFGASDQPAGDNFASVLSNFTGLDLSAFDGTQGFSDGTFDGVDQPSYYTADPTQNDTSNGDNSGYGFSDNSSYGSGDSGDSSYQSSGDGEYSNDSDQSDNEGNGQEDPGSSYGDDPGN